MQPFKFYLVTDTHYYDNALGADGEAYRRYMRGEQMCLKENSAILKATFEQIKNDKTTDTVIIPGDLSKDGQRLCHLSFLKELEDLKGAGKKIYVITARHDFCEKGWGFSGDKRTEAEGTSREELYSLYYEYGYKDALCVDKESLSYVQKIAPGIRLLALNCDGSPDGHDKGSFDERLLDWIKEQCIAAKAAGDFIFAINHYPILLASPIFTFVGDAKMKNYKQVASFLADNGVNLVFTGHMHIQSIKEFTSESGNKLYDVCTSALVGSPAMYRTVEFTADGKADIKSIPVPSFDCDMDGLTNTEYFNRQFDGMILNKIDDILSGLKGALKPLGIIGKKTIDSLTVGGVGRLLMIKTDKAIKKVKVKDFATSVVRGIFSGDAPYTIGTPEYKAAEAALKRLRFVIKKAEKKLSQKNPGIDLNEIILGSLGNNSSVSDNNAVLDLNA